MTIRRAPHPSPAPPPSGPLAVVFTGGERPSPDALDGVPRDAYVIAADSGLHHALDLGWPVHVVVGDFDSVDVGLLARAESRGAVVEPHPEAKDHTDLELALRRARELGARQVVVVGGGGGRFDHLLANALVLASAEFAPLEIEARHSGARIHVVRSLARLSGSPGELVTLLPIGGPVHGVTTAGLLYPLACDTLIPGTTRGVSNELLGEQATVEVGSGVLIAIQPGGRGTHVFRQLTGGIT
ncbi:thiamine diphosphokinase [Rhabdothermincola sediminis]|uniref:thiamine diphosphokinase n=1 Tax=Rhabdothermincola sediminis TaxID=2751370 RepID=UPI001AA0A9E2|nr:thiamine diphosphokinase [Rhabdothermincola sediminis]